MHLGSRTKGFLELPTLFWLDVLRSRAARRSPGRGRARARLVVGFANAVVLAALWALYMSFVHVGQDWYGYGWEIQLLETGFLAIFLVPARCDPRPFPDGASADAGRVGCCAGSSFRIMLGAGLIKLRGDPCWRDLTCLDYHYETQPIPNPLSRCAPPAAGAGPAAGVLFNHVVELVAPWFAFGPRGAARRRVPVGRLPGAAHRERQPLVPELADDRPDRRVLRRRSLARVLPARLRARAERARAATAHARASADRRVGASRRWSRCSASTRSLNLCRRGRS